MQGADSRRRFIAYLACSAAGFILVTVPGWLSSNPAHAKSDPRAANTASARPARATAAVAAIGRLQGTSTNTWSVRWSDRTGLPRELRGGRTATAARTPGEAAGQFLTNYGDLFGLATGAPRLIRQQSTPAGTKLTYEQTVAGVPVLDGRIGVIVDAEMNVVHAASSAQVVDRFRVPELSVEEALAIGAASTGLPLVGQSEPAREVVVVSAEPHAGYEFRLLMDAGYSEPWRIVVDGVSGEIVRRQRLVQNATGSARVFDPNPVCTLADVDLRDRGDSNSAVPPGAYYIVPLERLDPPVNGVYELSGQFARMTNYIIPTNVPPTSPNGVFEFYRSDNAFEEVMAYYTVDQSQAYIQSLGFDAVNNRAQEIDAHGYFGQDNSRYVASPLGAGYLEFGDGGVDDAEDADIILHEYGHAIQDNTAPGVYMGDGDNGYGNETGAMGEGFCDFWAAVAGLEASLQTNFPEAWVGEWDALGYITGPQLYMRTVDSEKIYPDDMVGQVHTDGEIWSAGLWNLSGETGVDLACRIVLLSHFLVADNPDFLDGANALLSADALLYPTEASPGGPIVGAHFNQICSAMSARGILTCSLICNCEHHADPYEDGNIDVTDVAVVIDEAFFLTGEPIRDPLCPHISRSDYNCDSYLDVLDISYAVDYVLRGGTGPCDPCIQ